MNVFCASRALQKLPFLLGDVGPLGGYEETWKAKGSCCLGLGNQDVSVCASFGSEELFGQAMMQLGPADQ